MRLRRLNPTLVLLLAAAAGCHRARLTTLEQLRPPPVLRLEARPSIVLLQRDAEGRLLPGDCRASTITGTLVATRADTLVLDRATVPFLAVTTGTCPRQALVEVVRSAHPTLEVRIIEPSTARSFWAGVLTVPAVLCVVLMFTFWGVD